jgi:hypothetical protein
MKHLHRHAVQINLLPSPVTVDIALARCSTPRWLNSAIATWLLRRHSFRRRRHHSYKKSQASLVNRRSTSPCQHYNPGKNFQASDWREIPCKTDLSQGSFHGVMSEMLTFMFQNVPPMDLFDSIHKSFSCLRSMPQKTRNQNVFLFIRTKCVKLYMTRERETLQCQQIFNK